jgi:hypothetical protein
MAAAFYSSNLLNAFNCCIKEFSGILNKKGRRREGVIVKKISGPKFPMPRLNNLITYS